MNYIDLFSGIGGFALGAEWAGIEWEKHYFSEIDEYAIKVYQKRFPEAINLGDITKIETEKLPKGEYIITGGFPCQPVSVAGKREAQNDIRWLWPEFKRIIRGLNTRLVIIENVAGLLSAGRTGPEYQCLCGWFGRWRRVNMDTEGKNQSAIPVSWNKIGLERKRMFRVAVQNMGGKFSQGKQGKEKGARRNLLLDNSRENNGNHIDGDISIFESQTSSGGSCATLMEYLESEKRRSLSGMLPFENTDDYTEQDWARICPACGWELADCSEGKLRGEAIAEIFNDLSEIGFACAWQDIRAEDVGAPHRRERIWIVAYPCMVGWVRGDCKENGGVKGFGEESSIWRENGNEFEMGKKDNGYLHWQRTYKPEFARVVNGVPHQLDRLRCLGNSIVPQIAQLLFERIKEFI